MQIVGKELFKIGRIVQKQIAKAFSPLLTNGGRRRKDDTGLTKVTDQLQSQHSLTATGSRNNVNLSIGNISVGTV